MIKKYIFILSAVFLLFACNNDESVKSLDFEDSALSVVGRWYSENNSDNPTFDMFGEYVFTADGVIYIDEYRRINGYKRNELQGKYSTNGNSITTEFDFNEGGQSTSSLKVTDGLTFSSSFHRFSEDYTLTFQRIVGEITLMVGDTLNVATEEAIQSIESYTSKPMEIKKYFMTDDAIASVNDNGLLVAKLIGTTYLKVETSIGIAVLKISVSDNENLWNDFSKVLGKDFDEVEHVLGKHYAYKSNDSIRYYYDNPYVDSVDIYRQDHNADSIIVYYSEKISESMLINYLGRKLILQDSLSYMYTNNKNLLLSTCSAKYYVNERKVVYSGFDPKWDDRMYDYGLSFEEIVKKYGDYRSQSQHTLITYKNLANGFINEITYFLDPFVYESHIIVNPDISDFMIKDFLNKKFLYKNSSRPFVRNVQIDGKEMFVWVSIEGKNGHSLYYHFEENKSK